MLAEPPVVERGDSLLWPAAARAETGVPERKERDLAWLGGALGVVEDVVPEAEDRGVALEVADEALKEELGSLPTRAAFLAATVDMIDV